MATPSPSPTTDDSFGLWYRISAPALISLLHVVGPAQLDERQDPRRLAERDYLRRCDLHRQRHGKPPLTKNPLYFGSSIDPLIVALVAGPLCLLLLIAWAVASKL